MDASQISELLPHNLKELSELIGLDPTLSLIKNFGGSALYIPKSVGANHKLSCLGLDVIKILVQTFGGSVLHIPLCRRIEKEIRNQQITEARQSSTIAALAKEFDLSERHIWLILKKGRDNAAEIKHQSTT
jgi:Mor family transcriptional regulator